MKGTGPSSLPSSLQPAARIARRTSARFMSAPHRNGGPEVESRRARGAREERDGDAQDDRVDVVARREIDGRGGVAEQRPAPRRVARVGPQPEREGPDAEEPVDVEEKRILAEAREDAQ